MIACHRELVDAGYVHKDWEYDPERFREVQFEGLSEPPVFMCKDDWKILFTTKGKLDVNSFKSK